MNPAGPTRRKWLLSSSSQGLAGLSLPEMTRPAKRLRRLYGQQGLNVILALRGARHRGAKAQNGVIWAHAAYAGMPFEQLKSA